MSARERWLGLTALVRDAVVNGSAAVEQLQKETARRPFSVLEQVAPIAAPSRVIHALHNGSVTVTHAMIRLVARTAGNALEAVLDGPSPEEGAAQGTASGARMSGPS